MSADGHPVAGALAFLGRTTQRRRTAAADARQVVRITCARCPGAVQAIGYLGLFLAAGLVVFAGWLLPALPRLDVLRCRLRRIARGAASFAALAGLLQLPLSGAYQQGLGFAGLLEASAWFDAGGRASRTGHAGRRPRHRRRPPGAARCVAVPATSQRRERWWRLRPRRSSATRGPSRLSSWSSPPTSCMSQSEPSGWVVWPDWRSACLRSPAGLARRRRRWPASGSCRRSAHPAGRQRFAAGLADHRLLGRPVRYDVRSPADREGDDRCAGRRDRGLEPVRAAASHHGSR